MPPAPSTPTPLGYIYLCLNLHLYGWTSTVKENSTMHESITILHVHVVFIRRKKGKLAYETILQYITRPSKIHMACA